MIVSGQARLEPQVERLDPKPLNVRPTGPKRVEVNSLHLSAGSFWHSERGLTASVRLSAPGFPASELIVLGFREHGRRRPSRPRREAR